MNLYEKMAAITAELQTVAKNLTVQQTKTSAYKAVYERDILDAVKPLESKYGIYSYPSSREILESNMLESESEWQGKVTKKTTFMTRIKTVYRFVNIEKPEEYIETTSFAEGIDSQDKGSGKAMTYSDKYALMKAYKISTGDDPDQTASIETKYTKKSEKSHTYSDESIALLHNSGTGIQTSIASAEEVQNAITNQELNGPAQKEKIKAIQEACKKHKIDSKTWLKQNGKTWETLTESDAINMLFSIKKKYGDE